MASDKKNSAFQAALDSLRNLGTIGRLLAWALHGIAMYMGVTVGVVVGLVVAWLKEPVEWIRQPGVYVPALAGLFTLWTYIGVRITRRWQSIQTVKIAVEYPHALIVSGGWKLTLGQFGASHQLAGKPAATLTLFVKNTCAGPVFVKVEEIRLVLNGRTHNDTPSTSQVVLAREADQGFRTASVEFDSGSANSSGTAVLKLLYGPPGGRLERRFIVRSKIQIGHQLSDKSKWVLADELIEKTDTPYVES